MSLARSGSNLLRIAGGGMLSVGAAGGDTNPHNYPLATITYRSEDYNTEDSADIYDDAATTVEMVYQASGGTGNSGHWRAIPDDAALEVNNGWVALGFGGSPAVDETDLLVFYYKLRLSSLFLEDMRDETSGFGDSGHKILDVFMWNSGGTGRDNTTRQVIKFLHTGSPGAGGLYWSHLKGGAGNEYTDDGVNTPIDMYSLPDEWFDVWHVFDRANEVTRSYIKRSSDSDVQVVLERFSSASGGYTPAADEPYVYTARGWNDGEGQTGLWYFWDDLTLAANSSRYVDIDSLRIGNGWFEPI